MLKNGFQFPGITFSELKSATVAIPGNFIPASAKTKNPITNMTSRSTGAGHNGNMFAALMESDSVEAIKSTKVATPGNFIPASAKTKNPITNMTSRSTGAGHNGNMFAALMESNSVEAIKSTKVATKSSAPAKAIKSAPAATVEFTFGGETFILPSNLKCSVVTLGEIRICASQLVHLFKKVHTDCTSTGSTKCRHPSGLNHIKVCWESIHGNSCDCKKVHIDLTPFAKNPQRPVEVVDVFAAPSYTPTTVSKPNTVTFGDLLRAGDWDAFVDKCLAQSTFPKATGKKLMCNAVVCFKHCKRGARCGFAHTTAEQSIDLPTHLVQILGTCDAAAQLKIVEGIREEILTVITKNIGQVQVLLAQQANVTEFEKFTHAKSSQELKQMKKDMEQKTRDSKLLRKLGKNIPDIPLHRLSDASTTDLMKMWWGLACNDHLTFALFGRAPVTPTFLLEDFVWTLTRLCALKPCFTWTFYDEKYIQPQATAATIVAEDEWTTVEKKAQQPKVVVDDKDVCFGGINCNKGRHSHTPIVDIDGLFTPVEVVVEAVVPTADDFTALCETRKVEPQLGNWNTLAAKHLPEPEIIAPKRVAPTPVVKTVEVVEPTKPKRKKRGPVEATEDFDGPRAEFNFDDVVAVDADDFSISAYGIVSFTMADVNATKSPKTKRSKKSQKNKVETKSIYDFVLRSVEEELMDTPVFDNTRVSIRRPKRAKAGEQLIVEMEEDGEVMALKEVLKEQKTPFQYSKKGQTIVFSLKSANSFQQVFDALSGAFYEIGVDIDMIRRFDEKGEDFDSCEFTKVVKKKTKDELEEEESTVFTGSKSDSEEESGDEEDQWVDFDIE